jgi:ABC-type amino acid transport system permease subunit
LLKLKSALNWELFRAALEAIRDKQRKSNAGAKLYDAVLMFKVLILQSVQPV